MQSQAMRSSPDQGCKNASRALTVGFHTTFPLTSPFEMDLSEEMSLLNRGDLCDVFTHTVYEAK